MKQDKLRKLVSFGLYSNFVWRRDHGEGIATYENISHIPGIEMGIKLNIQDRMTVCTVRTSLNIFFKGYVIKENISC
jgi:hypothetical protein